MHAKNLKITDASMHGRLIKANGEVIEFKGECVELDVDELIAEYKHTVQRAQLLEQVLKQIPGIENRLK